MKGSIYAKLYLTIQEKTSSPRVNRLRGEDIGEGLQLHFYAKRPGENYSMFSRMILSPFNLPLRNVEFFAEEFSGD